MNQKVMLGFALIVLAVGVFGIYRWWSTPGSGTQSMEIQIPWICKNPECGKDFDLTTGEYAKMRVPGTSVVPCPHCGEIKTARGHKCPNPDCGRNSQSVGHGDAPEKCPHCGASMMGP